MYGRVTDEKSVEVRHLSKLIAVVGRQRAAVEDADLLGDALADVLRDPTAKALVHLLRLLQRRRHSGTGRPDRLVNADDAAPVLRVPLLRVPPADGSKPRLSSRVSFHLSPPPARRQGRRRRSSSNRATGELCQYFAYGRRNSDDAGRAVRVQPIDVVVDRRQRIRRYPVADDERASKAHDDVPVIRISSLSVHVVRGFTLITDQMFRLCIFNYTRQCVAKPDYYGLK